MNAKAAWILPALMLAMASIPAAEYENPVPWSYKPMQRPALPEVKNAAWSRDDLDRFILARLEKENLQPVGDASRAVWIRRASFDLRGLPPSQEEVEAFVRDPSADDAAFAKVVDAFL